MISRILAPTKSRRVLVIGMDCAEPSLDFGRYLSYLPNLRQLMATGRYGELETTIPAITVPAWSCMFSGRDPGELGIYGFQNRADYAYHHMTVATGDSVREPRVWDVAGAAGKRVGVIAVPQTYPVRPVNGCLVSCFLAPSTNSQYTFPAGLKDEIARVAPGYEVDVPQFRTEDKAHLLQQVYDMTDARSRVVKHCLRTKPWDLFLFVEIGLDRLHHAMWSYADPAHRRFTPGSRYEHAIRDYYAYLDAQIGEMLSLAPDDTTVIVLSDHGAKAMAGGFCLNEWLIREGYLVLSQQPEGIVPLSRCHVDWSRTRAWGAGGYYGRVFLNVQGREPQGIIAPQEYEAVLRELVTRLEATIDPKGNPLDTRAFRPQQLYRRVNGISPDLIVYFGDLAWRSVGTLGHGSVHTFENDIGPDDANHAQRGLYIISGRGVGRSRGQVQRTWQAVAPTVLEALGLQAPAWMGAERL
ncbi:MAG: alkaline phosphatase family protein [Anaerolineae bacterium]